MEAVNEKTMSVLTAEAARANKQIERMLTGFKKVSSVLQQIDSKGIGEIAAQAKRAESAVERLSQKLTDTMDSFADRMKAVTEKMAEIPSGSSGEAKTAAPEGMSAAVTGLTVVNGLASEISSVVGEITGSPLMQTAGAAAGKLNDMADVIKTIKIGEDIKNPTLFSKLAEAIFMATEEEKKFDYAMQASFGKGDGIVGLIAGAALAISSFIQMFSDGFSWINEALMLAGIGLAAVGAIILGANAGIAAIVAAVVAVVATAVIVIKEHWTEISAFFAGIGNWVNETVIQPMIGFFQGFWETVSGFFQNLWLGISAIWSTVSAWFSEYVIEPLAGFFLGLWTRVQQMFEGLWIIIQAVWILVSGWFNENVIIPLVGFFQGFWEAVSGFFSTLWSGIQEIWIVVSGWFNENVIVPLAGFFQGFWETVSGFFSMLWDVIQEKWSSAASWFNEKVIQPLQGFFEGLWSGIKGGVVGAMNAVIGGIESGINFIVGGINSIISGFNKIVSWAAKVAEVDWNGVSLVQRVRLSRISMYAGGGMPNTGELFIARENGINEMVGRIGSHSAIVNNDQIVAGIRQGVTEAFMDVLMAAGSQEERSSGVIEIPVYIGSEEIARATHKGMVSLRRRGMILPEFL